jgi:hypothetical protein
MKHFVILVAVLMIFGMSASLVGADMPRARVSPMGTEGPDIRTKAESKSVAGPDVRHVPSPLIPNVEGIVTR